MVRARSPSNALGGFPSSLLCLVSFSSSSKSAKVKGSSPSPRPQNVSEDRIGIGSPSSGSEGVSPFCPRTSNAFPAKASLVVSPWFSFIKARRLSFSTPHKAQRSMLGKGS